MRAGEDREIQGIVIAKAPGLAGRMAQVTVLTIIAVSGNTGMVLIGIGPVMFMAAKAGEILEIIRVNVAGRAVVPFAGMLTGVDGEEDIVIGQQSRAPATHLVAFVAFGSETGGNVIGTGNFEILLLVTSHASGSFER